MKNLDELLKPNRIVVLNHRHDDDCTTLKAGDQHDGHCDVVVERVDVTDMSPSQIQEALK